LPAGADAKKISSTEVGLVNAPACCGYTTWQSLTDVTGDGRPDLVYQDAGSGKLWVARNTPGAGGSTTFSPGAQLQDSTFANGAFETRTGPYYRFNYDVADVGIDEVWRKAIDINGDGRIDIIDAAEEPGYWVVYLNTPDSGPSGVKWVRRKISIERLYHHLSIRGHMVDANYVPLSRRFTGHQYTKNLCLIWNGSTWQNFPQGWAEGRCDGVPNEVTDWGEVTVTEWDVMDVNGDGYPDVVLNRYRVDLITSQPPDGTQVGAAGGFREQHKVRPVSGPPYEINAVLNLRGILFEDGDNLFSTPITIRSEHDADTACGVRRWVTQAGAFGNQTVICDIADVNGDGLADRIENGHDVFLGIGNGFSKVKLTLPGPFAIQESDQRRICGHSLPPSTKTFGAAQIQGLRDLNGDGIPDFIEHVELNSWRVWFGTGTGFAAPVEVDVPGGGLAISGETEICDGEYSRTLVGLYDIDGDGRPEIVGLNGSSLDVYQLVGNLPGSPEAGRLVAIDNGYGAVTNITYRSAKEDGTTPHQVPFPEIVVTSVEAVGTRGLGGTLSATRYAFGDAEMIFNPVLDAFTLPAYGRSVELRAVPGPGDELHGLAVLSDTYGLDPFVATRKDERFGRYLRVGTVRDRTVVKNAGTDPWALLAVDVTSDPRRIAAKHYDRTPKLFEGSGFPGIDAMDCLDIMYPNDFGLSFAYNLGSAAVQSFCSAHGFLYASATDSWRGEVAPPSANNVATRAQVLEIDDYGRILNLLQANDRHRSDDDICIETRFAEPTGHDAKMLSAISYRRIWDCANREGTHQTWAAERFEFDNLPAGQVSVGNVTAHIVERRATDDGSLLGSVRTFDTAYDGVGNPTTIRSQREDGAVHTFALEYDPFGLAKVGTTIQATGMPSLGVRVERDAFSLDSLTVTDSNLTQRGVDRDGFGRVVRSTFTPPGGTLGVLSTISYLGFLTADPLGRRVVTTSYADLVAPNQLDTASGRTATMYLDELGRERRAELALGQDYANAMLITRMRRYDPVGRVAFEADPFPSSQDPSSAYGTTFLFNVDGTPSCFIRGRGEQMYSSVADEPTERYPTCFTQSFANHEQTLGILTAAALLSTSPQSGVTRLATRSAIGRVLTRSTWKSGNRLEHASFAYDRLGQPTGMTRYQDPVALANAVQTSWRVDSLGQLLELNEPETATKYLAYSDWGELLEVQSTDTTTNTDHRLVTRYDALGRRIYQEERNNGVTDPDTINEYFYDVGVSVAPQVTPTYVLGRLAQVKAPTGEAYFSYDAFGRVNARTFTDPTANIYIEKSTFHGDGARSALEFYLPDTGFNQETVEYAYDSAARLRAMKFFDGSVTNPLYEAVDVDPFGRVRKAILGGVAHYEAKYADVGRRLMNETTIGSPLGSRRTIYLEYDPQGRELSRREIRNNAVDGPKTNVAYDALSGSGCRRRLPAPPRC